MEVQLAPSRRRSSPEQAAEAAVNKVQVAPKKRKRKNLGKAAEAAQNHSAVCTYWGLRLESGFRDRRIK